MLWPWLANKNLRSIKVSRKLPTYPSPKLTLAPTSHLGQNIYSGKVRWAVFLKPKLIYFVYLYLLDSAALSKAAAKNKKRAEKRRKERIQKVKENGGRVLEAMEMKDPVSILREQLQEAKNNQWYSGGNKTSSVRSSIILGSEEGLTSLTKSNSANFCGGKKKNDAFRGSYFLT